MKHIFHVRALNIIYNKPPKGNKSIEETERRKVEIVHINFSGEFSLLFFLSRQCLSPNIQFWKIIEKFFLEVLVILVVMLSTFITALEFFSYCPR